MSCDEMSRMMDALIDGELDAPTTARLEAHARTCPACAARLQERRRLVGLLANARTRPAPDRLRRAVEAIGSDAGAAGARSPAPGRGPLRLRAVRWLPAAAALLLGVAGFWLGSVTAQRGQGPGLAREAVSSHIRSLMAAHLTDVLASDQHVVKPWFAGKVDFSPPVLDFASAGFRLTGARLDYLGTRPVAAIVYAHKDHVINVFVLPDQGGKPEAVRFAVDRGYRTATWSDGRTRFCVVSDVAPESEQQFIRLLQDGVREGEPAPAK